MQKNQSAIHESGDVFKLLNFENNMYQENNDKNKYAHQKKDFANRLLAFFQRYSIHSEKVNDGFLELDTQVLFKVKEFTFMLDEFCSENKIEDKEKFFRECFSLLDEHSFGRLDNISGRLELKMCDRRIREEVMNMARRSKSGVSYAEIFEEVSITFKNFFMSDYVKFILGLLVEEGLLLVDQNKYYLI